MSKTYTTSQAAARLGVTSQTIRDWIDAGILEAKKLSPLPGSPFRISEEAIAKFERQRQPHTQS